MILHSVWVYQGHYFHNAPWPIKHLDDRCSQRHFTNKWFNGQVIHEQLDKRFIPLVTFGGKFWRDGRIGWKPSRRKEEYIREVALVFGKCQITKFGFNVRIRHDGNQPNFSSGQMAKMFVSQGVSAATIQLHQHSVKMAWMMTWTVGSACVLNTASLHLNRWWTQSG